MVENANVERRASTNDGKIKQVTSILHIIDAQDEDEGRYQCIVSNPLGTTYSDKARIAVHSKETYSHKN